MSDNITKRVGLGTAYGFAKAGGYEGTVAEFTELLGNIAIDLARIENLSVTVTTLPAGSQATASLNGSVLSLGIPKGDKGDKGNTGETGAPAGFGTVSATVDDTIGTPSVEVTASGADTAKNFAFAFHNLKGQKGDKGDTGEVSEAELTQAFEDFSANGTVANAEQLTTDIRANDQTPYLFRTAGGSVDIGDREYINGIVGGTVAWNQLALLKQTEYTPSSIGVTYTPISESSFRLHGTITAINDIYLDSGSGAIPYVSGHKYITWVSGPASASEYFKFHYGTKYYPDILNKPYIIEATGSRSYDIETLQTGEVDFTFHWNKIDLTQMFGSIIADYIYSLEQANAGAGVAWFKKYFPKPYYAYNAGELKSVKGLVSHDMVGFNAFDKDTMLLYGYISDETGEVDQTDLSSGYRCSDFIKLVPNQTYYIKSEQTNGMWGAWYDANKNFISGITSFANTVKTAPKEAYYVRLTIKTSQSGNPDTFCINLSWDGSEDGNYEPYQKWSYPLDSDLELRGIPKLDAPNNLYYDGDIYEPDGTVTRKYGIVDLSTLTGWSYQSSTSRFIAGLSTAKSGVAVGVKANMICAKYPTVSNGDSQLTSYDKVVALSPYRDVVVKDTSFNGDVSAFRTAMNGVYLVYELDTPTTETADPYISPQIVDDFGTEEFVISNTIAVPIPVGNNTDYPVNLKAKVEMMPNSPDGDGDYIVRQTNGTNEYVSIANNATIQNILARLEALEG